MYRNQIFVAMPSWTGRPYPEVIMNIFRQTAWENNDMWFNEDCIVSGRPVDQARNELVKRFLKSHCDYIWFVDDDNPPALDVLDKLLSHGKDFISALVPIRHGNRYLLNVFKNKNHITSLEGIEWPLIEIENAWTACILMSYELVEKVYKKTKWIPYEFKNEDHVLNIETDEPEIYIYQDKYIENWQNLYKTNPDWSIMKLNQYISEDLYFWRTAKKLWYTLYADITAHCTHYKVTTTKLKV